LFEILLASIDNHFSLPGLIISQLILGIASIGLIAWGLSKASRSAAIGLVLAVIVSAGVSLHYTIRPQVVSWLCLLGVLIVAEQISDSAKLTLKNILLFSLFIILWANTNVTEIIGIGIAGLWTLNNFSSKTSWVLSIKVGIIGMLASAINPYGIRKWLFSFETSSHPIQHSYIREFQQATILDPSAAICIFFFLILFLFIHYNPKLLSFNKTLACCLFGILGFSVVKFLPFCFVTLAFLVATAWKKQSHNPAGFSKFGVGIGLLEKNLQAPTTRRTALVVAICVFCIANNLVKLYRTPFDSTLIAKAAVDFMKEHSLPGPILNSFNDGGYLMYRYSDQRTGEPIITVPIDGRTNVNKVELVSNYLLAQRGVPGWQDYLNTIGPNTVLWANSSALAEILSLTSEWCRVYTDADKENPRKGWSVFLKKQVSEQISGVNCLPEPTQAT
jgi:hypothetical protein